MTRIDLLTNPMTTAEDLIVGGASGAPTRLAKGSDGQVLTVDPTTHALVWATPVAGGSTGIGWIDNGTHPDEPPGSPNTEDDEFDAGSLDAKWTASGGGSETFANSRMTVNVPSGGERLYLANYAPGAGTPFVITAKFTGCGFWESTDYYGISVYSSVPAAIAELDIRTTSTSIFKAHSDVPTAAQDITVPDSGFGQQFYLRLSRDASNNYTYGISLDGLKYQSFTLASRSSATTVAKIGFRFGQTAARTDKYGSIDWIRRT